MKDATSPSLVRIRRVAYFLAQEPKFATSTATEDYVKGNERLPFPKPTWDVARAIHQADLDPCKMDKAQIFEWATHILLKGPAPKSGAKAEPLQPEAATTGTSAQPTAANTVEPREQVTLINIPVRVAIYTLLASARGLTEFDKRAGAEELGKQIDAVAVAYLGSLSPTEKTYMAVASQPEKAEVAKAAEPTVAKTAAIVPPPAIPPTNHPVPTPA